MKLLNLFRKTQSAPHPGEGLPAQVVKAYNKTRTVRDTSLLCHAPFSNMYFNTEGDVALCWKTFHKAERYSPDKTIMELWQGANFQKIRQGIRDCNLDFGCQECKKHLLEGNYVNVLSKAYDNDHIEPGYPTIMEFELSNQCNLGCTMCNGLLSSTIRRDREHLPPLQSPYGDKFVEELREFIPHLREARFNGGEPFLIKIYYKIWDEIFKLNPGLKMVVATNGTVLTSKVKEYLERGNFHINLSMDGFSKETYENIRVKGDHDKLMENFEYFHRYCRERNRTLCIMINPMRDNWWEMPDFVNFCNDRDIHLWFNSIIKPADLALWSLSADELGRIYQQLSAAKIKANLISAGAIQRYNIRTYENLVHQQIKTWWEEAKARETEARELALTTPRSFKAEALKKIGSFFGEAQVAEKKMLLSRLSEVEELIPGAEMQTLFYKSVWESDPKVLLEMSQKHAAIELKEMFEDHLRGDQ